MKIRKVLSILTLPGVAAAICIVEGCAQTPISSEPVSPPPPATAGTGILTPLDSPPPPSRGFFMGLLPTPSEGQSLASAYQEASSFADFIPVWGRPTPFYDLARELSGEWGAIFVKQYIRENGMFPLVHLSFLGPQVTLASPPGMNDATLGNQKWRKAYRQAALDIARASRPLYLSLGNEVNLWYERYGHRDGDPDGFQHYVSLYHEIYDAVKEILPQTKVFCTFAREIVSENREADLGVLSLFDSLKLDLLVFTTYPYVVRGFKRPQYIPDDYYARALNYLPGKSIGLSECAWAALEPFGGERAQADFIAQVTGRLTFGQQVKLEFLGWPWLSALDDNDSIALIKKDGTARQSLAMWQNIFSGKK